MCQPLQAYQEFQIASSHSQGYVANNCHMICATRSHVHYNLVRSVHKLAIIWHSKQQADNLQKHTNAI